jgi:hypothetical protein
MKEEWVTLHVALNHPAVAGLRLTWTNLLEFIRQGEVTARLAEAPASPSPKARRRLRHLILLSSLLEWAKEQDEESVKVFQPELAPKTLPKKLTDEQVCQASVRRRLIDIEERKQLKAQIADPWDLP